jgi:hypothetical protein
MRRGKLLVVHFELRRHIAKALMIGRASVYRVLGTGGG